ncbi:YncE family protein [Thermodesulfobacteriota bacterium]
MKIFRICALFTLFLSMICEYSALAEEVDWTIQKTLSLKNPPVDVATSAGGSYLYVLTEDGTVHIYDSSSTLKGRIQVGKDVNSITAGPGKDVIFVKNTKEKTVKRILIEFIYDFNVKDSPFKGNADAPVSIVFFSDYQ